MESKSANSRQADVPGNGSHQSAQILATTLKRCRRNLGYVSVAVTLPALLLSNNIHEARSEDIKRSDTLVPEDPARLPDRLKAGKNSDLLRRQSRFRLPHQNHLDPLPASSDNDECPGHAVTPGTYTATTPYVEVGDTTGANNTVNSFYMYGFGYQTVSSPGPDHVYSFILVDRGADPRIEVSTKSATFSPLIYVLEGGFPTACPAGAAKFAENGLMYAQTAGNTATLDSQLLNWLPLNVPLYLFVDSGSSDAAGSYTLRMQDVTVAAPGINAIDYPGFFVRQHYLDFLGRFPDQDGLNFWVNEINSCGGDPSCIEVRRINDSGAFFLSIEFQEVGYLAYRTYKTAYGNLPDGPVPMRLNDFWDPRWQLGHDVVVNKPGWQQVLENNKQKFFSDFARSSRFLAAFPGSMTPAEFVDRLFSNAGVTPTSFERQAAINEFLGATIASDPLARGRALRRVAENPTLAAQEFNRAFVLMQYFGYLQRNPNDRPDGNFDGFNFWLDKLNQFNGDFHAAEMVKGFITSSEYRKRFGPEN